MASAAHLGDACAPFLPPQLDVLTAWAALHVVSTAHRRGIVRAATDWRPGPSVMALARHSGVAAARVHHAMKLAPPAGQK